jgi:hypothetical protein
MRCAFDESSTRINLYGSELTFYPPIPEPTSSNFWTMYADNNQNLFIDYNKSKYFYINHSMASGALNKTIIHNCPVIESIENYKLGFPVFLSNYVHKLVYDEVNNYYKYIPSISTDNENCIPSVKSSGTSNEFLGIITKIYNSMDNFACGKLLMTDIKINQDTIIFATHGDYIFKVNDTSIYNIGDSITYTGDIIDLNKNLTLSIISSYIGIVTNIIDNTTLSVFKK